MQPMKDFICAYFGKDWTITARGFSSVRQAEKHGLYMLPTAGVFGFAVIAENGSEWKLQSVDSILPPNASVIQDPKDCLNYIVSY